MQDIRRGGLWGAGLLLALSFAFAPARIFANDLTESVLFQAGNGGYHTYRIPSLITTPQGTLLAFCEGRKNHRGDSGDIDLLLKRSEDGGETWSDAEVVWDDAENTCGNPCPVVDERTGHIHLLLTWNLGTDDGHALHTGTGDESRRVFYSVSENDGRTWSHPVEITSDVKEPSWWWYATGPGVGIQLKRGPHRGRLIVPCDHTAPGYINGAHVIYSDDAGKSWQRSQPIKRTCNECQVVELRDGRLMINMRSSNTRGLVPDKERTYNGHRSIAFSMDGGATWTEPEFDQHLGDPVCQASLIRYDERQLLFSNPSPPVSSERGPRVRMTVRMSRDEGQSWPVSRLIHEGPSAYSCLARLPDGCVGLLYEAGEKHAYEALRFARFPLGWLNAASAVSE